VTAPRVSCKKSGGIKFGINGRSYFELVTVMNFAGSGVVSQMWIKGSSNNWMAMSRNWGAHWQSNAYLSGQSLSFMVKTDDGRVVTANNVVPWNWYFGATYSTWANFW
jgi:hypothetical protein